MQTLGNKGAKQKNVGAIVGDFRYLAKDGFSLIEKATQKSNFLYVFITENEKEKFAKELNLLGEQCQKYPKTKVLPSPCLVASINFSPAADARFFGREIASRLNIVKRYVREEKPDTYEGRRNEGLRDVMRDYGIELVDI